MRGSSVRVQISALVAVCGLPLACTGVIAPHGAGASGSSGTRTGIAGMTGASTGAAGTGVATGAAGTGGATGAPGDALGPDERIGPFASNAIAPVDETLVQQHQEVAASLANAAKARM